MTLDSSSIDRARAVAGPRGLSSYLDAALEDKLERDERRRTFLDYLDGLEAANPTSETAKRRASRRANRLRASMAP